MAVLTGPFAATFTINTTCTSCTNATIAMNTANWAAWNIQYANIQYAIVNALTWTNWCSPQDLVQTATEVEIAPAARRRAELDLANRRAEDLLRRELTPEQIEDLEKKQCFYLESVTTKRRYRIDRGTHGNVKLLGPDGKIIGTYCVQPDNVPVADVMLAQKLWIEGNEEGFEKVANYRPYA